MKDFGRSFVTSIGFCHLVFKCREMWVYFEVLSEQGVRLQVPGHRSDAECSQGGKGGKEEGLEVVDQMSMKKVQWCERTGRRGRAGGTAALMRIARGGGTQRWTKRGGDPCLLSFFQFDRPVAKYSITKIYFEGLYIRMLDSSRKIFQ